MHSCTRMRNMSGLEVMSLSMELTLCSSHCEGELCLGDLIGRHTPTTRCAYQGNHVVPGVSSPPSSEGGSQVTVTLYSPMEKKEWW